MSHHKPVSASEREDGGAVILTLAVGIVLTVCAMAAALIAHMAGGMK